MRKDQMQSATTGDLINEKTGVTMKGSAEGLAILAQIEKFLLTDYPDETRLWFCKEVIDLVETLDN